MCDVKGWDVKEGVIIMGVRDVKEFVMLTSE